MSVTCGSHRTVPLETCRPCRDLTDNRGRGAPVPDKANDNSWGSIKYNPPVQANLDSSQGLPQRQEALNNQRNQSRISQEQDLDRRGEGPALSRSSRARPVRPRGLCTCSEVGRPSFEPEGGNSVSLSRASWRVCTQVELQDQGDTVVPRKAPSVVMPIRCTNSA